MGKTMISARIPDEMDRDLDKLAASTNRSKSILVEVALEVCFESKPLEALGDLATRPT